MRGLCQTGCALLLLFAVIAEVRLAVRVWKDFYAIGAYRINQKRVGDEYNFAVGIEYKFRW